MNEKMPFTVDPDGKWIYQVGGLSALILGAGYLLTFPVIAYAGDFRRQVARRVWLLWPNMRQAGGPLRL